MAIRFSIAFTTILCFQSLWQSLFRGENTGGWYEMTRFAFILKASSSTSGVRSFVSNIFDTLWGALGSTKRPTLSQSSAKARGISSLSLETTFFKFPFSSGAPVDILRALWNRDRIFLLSGTESVCII